MSVTSRTVTADELAAMPGVGRAELIRGELIRMSPAGFEHGKLTARLSWRIARHVEELGLGVVCAAETGFLLQRNPDTVRAPDIAFVRILTVSDILTAPELLGDWSLRVEQLFR